MSKRRNCLAVSVALFSLIGLLVAPFQSLSVAHAETSTAVAQELPSLETQDSRVYQMPDGTIQAQVYFSPVNYLDARGNWQHIDTALSKDTTGFGVSKNLFGTHFSSSADSTAAKSLETVNYQGHQVAFIPVSSSMEKSVGSDTFTNLQSVPGHVNSNAIHYSGLYPDVSLQDTVTSEGVKESIVLDKYVPGLHSFAFILNTNGLSPEVEKDGSLDFKDSKGNTIFTMPHGVMTDSNIDPHSGDAPSSTGVTYSILQVAGKTVLKVSVDENWLADASRVYPVYIDPTVTLSSQISDAYVSSAYPTTNYSGSSLYDSSLGYDDLHVGDYDATTGDNWAYFKLPSVSQLPLLGLTVTSATFYAYCDWSYYTSTPETTWLYTNTSSNWTPSSITWNTKPGHGSAVSTASVYRNQWAAFNVTSVVQQWSNELSGQSPSSSPQLGLMLNENGNGQAYWHKYVAEGSSSSTNPHIDITYAAPSAPWGAMYTHDDNSTGYVNLWWNPVPGASSYNVMIFDGHQYEAFNVGNVTHWTSKGKGIWPTPSEVASGQWQLYHNGGGGELAMNPGPVYQNAYNANGTGTNYAPDSNYWFRIEAVASDGSTTSNSNAFTPTMQAYVPDEGNASTMVPLEIGSGDGATGNFVLQDTDLTTSGYGPQVSMSRTYNSNESSQTGLFGNGWTLGYQEHIAIINNLPYLIGADGSTSIFWPQPDGTYASPPGL
ncbi:DNRLRE domain-containing protein, partial [Alicyclobacillus cycloheptanicus]